MGRYGANIWSFCFFLQTHTAAMVVFLQSGIRSQECPSFHESYDIFFRGLEDWQTKSTNTNLLHATSHLWLRVAWSSQNGLEPFQPHFLRWHEPLLHQTSGFSTGWSWSNCKSWLTNMEFSWLKLRMSFGWLVDYDHSFFILIPIPHAKKIAGVFPAKFQHKTVRTPEREEDSPFWEPFKC